MQRRWFGPIIVLGLLASPTHAQSAGADKNAKPADTEATQDRERSPQTKAPAKSAAKKQPSSKDFRPSEQISADKAVSFPVDI